MSTFIPKTLLGFAFEQGDYSNRQTNITDIWLDSDKIPTVIPTNLDEEGYATVKVNGRDFKIVQKTSTVTQKISDNVYQSDTLKGILVPWWNDAPYPIEITDNQNRKIPLGLCQVTFDPIGGCLIFGKTPEAFEGPFKVDFWRYVGRNTLDGLLDTSGLSSMDKDYQPQNDQDVATKVYVDNLIKELSKISTSLYPPKPKTLEAVKLEVVRGLEFNHLLDNKRYPVLDVDQPVTLRVPAFYYPEGSSVSLSIDSKIVAKEELLDLESKAVDASEILDWMPSGWYKMIPSFDLEISVSDVPVVIGNPLHSVLLQQTYPIPTLTEGWNTTETVLTESTILGSESAVVDLFNYPDFKESVLKEKFVSGLSCIQENSVLKVTFGVSNYRYFKGVKGVEVTLGKSIFYFPVQETYKKYDPMIYYTVEEVLDYDTEGISLNIKFYNYRDELAFNWEKDLTLRVDTSYELDRVTSGFGSLPSIYGNPYDSKKSMYSTDVAELQYYRGKYRQPRGSYSTVQIPGFEFTKNIGLDGVEKLTRYATFKVTADKECHGLLIKLKGSNLEFDTYGIPKFPLQVKVEGSTGWLIAKPFYLGKNPKMDDEGCLVAESDNDKESVRITFGQTTYKGTIYIRVGIPEDRMDWSFEGLEKVEIL